MPTTYSSTTWITTSTTGNPKVTSGTTATVTTDNTATTTNGYCFQTFEWSHESAEEVEARRERRAKAKKKAMQLLREFLTRKQKYNLTRFGRFDFVGADRRVYRLSSESRSGNIYVVEDGKPVERYCAHPRSVPMGDVLLTQFFALKTNSKKVLEVANEYKMS